MYFNVNVFFLLEVYIAASWFGLMSIHLKIEPAGINNSRDVAKCLACYGFFLSEQTTTISETGTLEIILSMIGAMYIHYS